jgi:hypothetical protein
MSCSRSAHDSGRRKKSCTPARIASIKIALSDTSGPNTSGENIAATTVSGEPTATSSANVLS